MKFVPYLCGVTLPRDMWMWRDLIFDIRAIINQSKLCSYAVYVLCGYTINYVQFYVDCKFGYWTLISILRITHERFLYSLL